MIEDQSIRFDDGEAYENATGTYSRLIGAVFLDWLAPAPGWRWADIGCGNGAFTELIVQRTEPAEVHAIDPSEGQLAFARRRAGAAGAMFDKGDAMALPFETARFDAAVMALVLFFLPDPARGLAEMKRVVRPGGLVAGYVWDIPGGGLAIEPVRAALREAGIEPPAPPSAAISAMPALRAAFTEAGLAHVETLRIPVKRRFPDFDAYWTASLAAGGLADRIATLAPDTVEKIRAHTRAQLQSDAEGAVLATGVANAAKGVVTA